MYNQAIWRIIPGFVSGDRITRIYKPWKGHLEGEQPYLRDNNDHHGPINHLITSPRMILQVEGSIV